MYSTTRQLFLAAALLFTATFFICHASANADIYCQAGTSMEMYLAGDWLPVTAKKGPDNQGQCLIDDHMGLVNWVVKTRLRPVGGGIFTSSAQEMYNPNHPKVGQVEATQGPGKAPYCQVGSTLEMYFAREWRRVTVKQSPNRFDQCLVDEDGMVSWVNKERLRPIGGGTFAKVGHTEAMDELQHAQHPGPTQEAVRKFLAGTPTPVAANTVTAPTKGVYQCMTPGLDIGVGVDPSATVGLINANTYRNFNGKQGTYKYDTKTGVVTLLTGDSASLKYKKMSDRNLRLLKPNGQISATNCVLNMKKNPAGGGW